MGIFEILSLLCGLALFLYGMDVMGNALKKSAGRKLKTILGNLTSNQFKGFLLGLGVTAVIQSSSATTVMVVGFVNSGTMTLTQAIGVIMGANVGTAVTAWLTAMNGIGGGAAEATELLKWLKNFARRFFAQQFKRSCLPDGPKVGTVGVSPRGDLSMPSDASSAEWLKIIETL